MELCRNGGNHNRYEKPAQPDKIQECPKVRKLNGEGGGLPRPFLESSIPVQERQVLHDRQPSGGTVHPPVGERAEGLAVLQQ